MTNLSAQSYRRWLLALAGLGLILRLAFALLPLSEHLVLLEDDAWMVTGIARNWAIGRGITADGVTPTNGFHPLYPLTLGALPYLAAPDNLDFGFTANLVICAILAALVVWPLSLVVRRLAGDRAALLAVGLYALNPTMIRLTVNGMESAMALLLWITTVWATMRLDLTRLRGNLLLAAITAAMILTRLDGALLFAAIAGARFLWAWREGRLRRELPPLAGYVAATFALLIPYFWRNLAVFGSFSPSSGQALTYLHSYADSYAISNGLDAWYANNALPVALLGSLPLVFAALLAFAGLAWWAVGRELWKALPMLLYMIVPPIYYGYMMQQDNPRHFTAFSLVITILLAWALARLWERLGRRGALVAGTVAGAVVLLQGLSAAAFWREQHATASLTQPTMYQAALWMRDNLPAGALIGAKNSGIYQYYSGHSVINIDGKLNHEILAVYEQRSMLDYLGEKHITYLIDREATLADHIQFYSRQFGERPSHRVPGLAQQLKIYAQLALKSLGLGAGPTLDRRDGFVPSRPFSDVATPLQTFARPNESANPVVLFELKDSE
ncbi:MAG TPA: glycosyltransferase family 39 protein [Herpetosiphonaceae bacterium]|nr:glycosyltransferase family 39 protein [Herpetosiphonaceae bacterium]